MSISAADRRWAVLVGALGIITFVPIYLVIYHLQARGQSAAAVDMSDMHMNQMGVFWSFPVLQASGIAALIWAYIGIVLGLLVSGRPPSWWPLNRPQTDRLHRQISLLVIALIVVHAVATSVDAMGDSLRTAFLPSQESWTAAVFAYNLGILALYLAVLVGPTYYLRRRIGTRWWMIAHRLALIVYIMSVWHTLLLGADFAFYSWLRVVTWIAQIPLLALLVRRLVKPRRRGAAKPGSARDWLTHARYWLTGVCVAATAGIVVLVGTGNAELPRRVGTGSASAASHGVDWLPGWLGIAMAVLLGLVGLVHLRHLVHLRRFTDGGRRPADGGRLRGLAEGGPRVHLWHGAHVLMAAGMIDMAVPTRHMLVPARAGEIVFAVAAVLAGLVSVVHWRAGAAGRRTGLGGRAAAVLPAVTCADLAIMAYMFALMGGAGSLWLIIVLSAWLTLEAVYWSSGKLGTLAGHAPATPHAPAAPQVQAATQAQAVTQAPVVTRTPALAQAPTVTRVSAITTVMVPEQADEQEAPVQPGSGTVSRYRIEVAATLTVMCLLMAYMLVAMHFGAQMAGTPGMGGMPGM